MINEKLLQEVIQKHLPKAFIGYGQQGFMCQVHYPELCKIINDYTQQQVSVEPEVKVQIASIIQQAVKDWNVTVINPFDKEDADITASIANDQIKQFALYLEQQINESNLPA